MKKTELTRLFGDKTFTAVNSDEHSSVAGGTTNDANRGGWQSYFVNWFKSFIFGAYSGLMATLILISAGIGCDLRARTIQLIGFSYLAANALNTGISEFFTAKTHKEFLQQEKRKAAWEVKHFRDKELVARYQLGGMRRKEAELAVGKMTQMEIGQQIMDDAQSTTSQTSAALPVVTEEEAHLISDSSLLCLSHVVCGSVPLFLISLGLTIFTSERESSILFTSILITMLLLLVLGFVKNSFGQSHLFYAGYEGLLLGLLCSFSAYCSGVIVSVLMQN